MLTQNITFDNEYNLIPANLPPLKLRLQIDWAPRQGQSYETSQAVVSFNGVLIDNLISS